MAALEERETHVLWDYAEQVVRIFTTEEGVVSGINRRLANTEYLPDWKKQDNTYRCEIPFAACRYPAMVAKILDPKRDRGTNPFSKGDE